MSKSVNHDIVVRSGRRSILLSGSVRTGNGNDDVSVYKVYMEFGIGIMFGFDLGIQLSNRHSDDLFHTVTHNACGGAEVVVIRIHSGSRLKIRNKRSTVRIGKYLCIGYCAKESASYGICKLCIGRYVCFLNILNQYGNHNGNQNCRNGNYND